MISGLKEKHSVHQCCFNNSQTQDFVIIFHRPKVHMEMIDIHTSDRFSMNAKDTDSKKLFFTESLNISIIYYSIHTIYVNHVMSRISLLVIPNQQYRSRW